MFMFTNLIAKANQLANVTGCFSSTFYFFIYIYKIAVNIC